MHLIIMVLWIWFLLGECKNCLVLDFLEIHCCGIGFSIWEINFGLRDRDYSGDLRYRPFFLFKFIHLIFLCGKLEGGGG